MPRLLCLPLLLLTLAIAGCGLTDPTTVAAPAAPDAAHDEPSTNALPAYVGSQGQRTPQRAAERYGELLTRLAAEPDATTTESLLRLVSKAQAPATLAAADHAIAEASRLDDGERLDLVNVSIANPGPAPIGYAIVRSGRYTQTGSSIGESHLTVYAIAFKQTRRGWIIDRWGRAE